jgi:hypothetical protein
VSEHSAGGGRSANSGRSADGEPQSSAALFTFETVSAALNCELVFKELSIACRIIPVPRALDSSCTYAIVTETADIPDLCAALKTKGAAYKKVFRCAGAGGRDFEELDV